MKEQVMVEQGTEWASEGVKALLGVMGTACAAVVGFLIAAWKKPSHADIEKKLEPLQMRLTSLETRLERAATKEDLQREVGALTTRFDLQIRPMAEDVAEIRTDLRFLLNREAHK